MSTTADTFDGLLGLALSRCGEGGASSLSAQAGAASEYTRAAAEAEMAFALADVLDALPREHLGGLTRAARVVTPEGAQATDTDGLRPVPGVSFVGLTAGLPGPYAGSLAVSLPVDTGRLLSVSLASASGVAWNVSASGLLPFEAGPGLRPPVAPFRASIDAPQIFAASLPWVVGDTVTELPSVILAPSSGALAVSGGVRLLYAPSPDAGADDFVRGLPALARDAAAWACASRLLSQDPETMGMAAQAEQRRGLALDRLRPLASRVSRRPNLPYG